MLHTFFIIYKNVEKKKTTKSKRGFFIKKIKHKKNKKQRAGGWQTSRDWYDYARRNTQWGDKDHAALVHFYKLSRGIKE